MSAGPARRGPLTAAAGAVVDFLVEREEGIREPTGPGARILQLPRAPRVIVAVVGLRARSGTTTVARALAAELAARDPCGAAVVSPAGKAPGVPLALPAGARLARTLATALPVPIRTVGLLCLADCTDRQALVRALDGAAPLVLDIGDPPESAAAAALADSVVIVAAAAAEPALAAALSISLARVGPEPLVVLNRARGEEPEWEGRCTLALPQSRAGAQFALAGREPRGVLGFAVASLADLVEERP